MDSCLCLCRDLIPDRVCTHHPSNTFPPGTGDANSGKLYFPEPFTDTCKAFPDNPFRIAGRAEILEINDVSLPVCENKVCTCGTNINAKCTAVIRDHAGHFRLIETCAFCKDKPRKKGSLHLFSFFRTPQGFDKFPAAKEHLFPVFRIRSGLFKIAFPICAKASVCMKGRPCCCGIQGIVWYFQFPFFQFKDFTDGTFHSGILGNTAAEHDRFLHWKVLHDCCLIIADQCVAEPEQDIRGADPLLLAVDDICFGKYSTAS